MVENTIMIGADLLGNQPSWQFVQRARMLETIGWLVKAF